MKQMTGSRWLGVAAIVAGFMWIAFLIRAFSADLLAGRSRAGEYVILLAFTSILTTPAALGIYYGARVLETPTIYRVRRASAVVYVVFALAVHSAVFHLASRVVRDESYDDLLFSALLLACTTVAIAFHAITCRVVTRREGFHILGYREFVGKLAIFIVAFEIWTVGEDLTRMFFPLNPVESANLWLDEAIAFSPLIFAWAFYRISVRFVRRGRWEPTKAEKVPP
ncbi:MAG: hypothetical protein KJ060_08290 [Candidatus Hydrogenedentes bacterium]|nr:hypothetical protein [Candidatus Hydrogenedentota bacterium]